MDHKVAVFASFALAIVTALLVASQWGSLVSSRSSPEPTYSPPNVRSAEAAAGQQDSLELVTTVPESTDSMLTADPASDMTVGNDETLTDDDDSSEDDGGVADSVDDDDESEGDVMDDEKYESDDD
jgi:hypothetical protein